MQFKHKDLGMGGTTVIRHMEGCKPILVATGGTPKVSAKKDNQVLEMASNKKVTEDIKPSEDDEKFVEEQE